VRATTDDTRPNQAAAGHTASAAARQRRWRSGCSDLHCTKPPAVP
jgi:hypothetical protein